jgi:PAS domain S-box-containing protein
MIWGKKKPVDQLLADLPGKILETVDALIVVLDPEGRIIIFNNKCQELTGYKETDVKGRILWDVLIPKDRVDELKNYFSELISGHFTATHTNPWLTKDGQQRTIQWRSSTIAERDGKARWVIATGLDVSDRLVERDELQQMATASHYNPAPIVQLTRQGVVTDCNTAALRAFNKRRLVGDQWVELCPGLSAASFERFAKAPGTEPLSVEARLGPKTFQFAHFAIPDRDIIQVYGFEVSASRESLERLKDAQTALDAVTGSLPDALFTVDPRGVLLECSAAAEQLTGYRRADLVGKNLARLRVFAPRQFAQMLRAPAGKAPRVEETELGGKDRRRVPVAVTRIGIRREGKPAVLLIARDLSERKKTNDELARCRKELEVKPARTQPAETGPRAAEKEQLDLFGRLAFRLSRDLNTRFGSVRNSTYYVESLLPPDVDPGIAGHLKSIGTTVDQVEQTVADLRTALRPAPSERSRTTVGRIIEEAGRLAPMGSSIRIESSLPNNLPDVEVDLPQIAQAIADLMFNARDAMPQGGTLRIDAQTENRDVIIGVSDTGPGIPPEPRSRIFDLPTSDQPGDDGLGLFLVKRAVEANRGRIEVVSERDKGTTFRLHFPIAGVENGAQPADGPKETDRTD